jgi:hypothetical protein
MIIPAASDLLEEADDDSTVSSHNWRVEEALKKHGQSIFKFWYFLHDFPMMGLAHPIGRKIVQALKACPQTSIRQSHWFRANQMKAFLSSRPSHQFVPEQRYNSGGQPYLYLSNDAKCAVAESTFNKEIKTAWVQRFQIEHLDNVLDLRAWNDENENVDERDERYPLFIIALIFSDLLTQCPEHYFNGENPKKIKWKQAYLMPRFVADAAKYCGFSSVLYSSVRLQHDNLVVFDSDWSPKPDGDSYELSLTEEDLIIKGNFFYTQGEQIFVLGSTKGESY